jgi:hypothetical protein
MDTLLRRLQQRVRPSLRSIAAAACAIVLAACSPTITVKRTQTLAAAGTAYVAAVEALVAEDRDQYIDADSQILLARMHDQPALEHSNPAQARTARSEALTKSDARLKAVIDKYDTLLRQLDLEQNYFTALAALTSDDANTAAANTLASVADALNQLNVVFAKGAKPAITADEKTALSGLAGQIGDAIKSQFLREALRRDAVTVSEALAWNARIVADLAPELDAIANNERKDAYEHAVIEPYITGTVSDSSSWETARRNALTAPLDQDAAAAATAAAQKLRIAWQAALSNKLDSETIQSALTDIQALAASLEAIHKARDAAIASAAAKQVPAKP